MANPLDAFKGLPPWGKAAVGVGGAGAVYLVWRAHQNANAAPSSPDGLSTPDQAAGAGTGDGLPVIGAGTTGAADLGTTTGYGTLDQWSSAAQAGLAEVGFDPVATATALGAYLNGQALTADQAAIVNAAKAEFSTQGLALPPVVLASSSGPASTGNDTTPVVSGGHVVSVNNNEAVVGWTGRNAVSYRVTLTGPNQNGRQNTVDKPEASYEGLLAGHEYTVTVVPVGADGHTGRAGKINVKTTKGK